MTPLRQRMVEDMRVRNLSANTQRAYLQQVGTLAKHFGRSLATLGPEEIRAWQLRLVEVRQLARSSKVTETAALPFPTRPRSNETGLSTTSLCRRTHVHYR